MKRFPMLSDGHLGSLQKTPNSNYFTLDIIYFIPYFSIFSPEMTDVPSERRSISIISVRAGMRLWV